MKSFTIIVLLFILHVSLCSQSLPLIKASKPKVSLREGALFKKDYWTITPSLKPDQWDVVVPSGSSLRCSFITDLDSISFLVEQNKHYEFIVVLNNKDSAYTRISGRCEPVVFSPEYQKRYRNTTSVEVPEVYELTNILIALTDKGIHDSDLVDHTTLYYQEVMQHFGKFKDELVVHELDSTLKNQWWKYFYIKMDSYAYIFEKQQIVKGNTYDRLNWDGIPNTFEPFRIQAEEFAQKTDFLAFYSAHQSLYRLQIQFYVDSVHLDRMQVWLNKNFPTTHYDCFKVLFSPLVGGSQSATRLENNHFKEAQVHINFPYYNQPSSTWISEETRLLNSNILFTELNHAYINPEAEKYLNTVAFVTAFDSLGLWETKGSAAQMGYPNAVACFNEYMNWGLVSLYYLDYAPKNQQTSLIERIEQNMKQNRGFSKFPEFNQGLIQLYQTRKENQTIADLYPAILQMCVQIRNR